MSTPPSSPSIPPTLPLPSTLPVLLGRSNYPLWHTAIHPVLASHPEARALLSGSWTDPGATHRRSLPSPAKLVLVSNPNSHTIIASPSTASEVQSHHVQSLEAWERANLAICRFIRGTLAMNVLPFVRRYVEAKALWDTLVGLYCGCELEREGKRDRFRGWL